MLKVLAGNLSATFNLDGLHLERYFAKRLTIVQSICDQLLLHDRILIPIQDYVTMAGLVRILGERNLLTLLAEERLAFVMTQMQVRILGPDTDVANNVVDACLALGLMNVELYLANQFDCVSSASAAPIGDCISLKMPRLTGIQLREGQLWEFLDVTGVPDIAAPLLADKDEMARFIRLTRGRDAEAFRQWFHENRNLSDKDLLKAYMDVLHETPWAQGTTGKVLRMAASLGLSAFGLGFVADAAASTIDNFVVDKFVRARGAKFFIDDLRNFSGIIKS